MGCFNITGFHTKLPITYGNEVFGIIGIHKNRSKRNEFSPGRIFTPIALPIFGTYDDYGSIDDIKRDSNTELIEKITGVTIEEFIHIIDNYTVKRYGCEEPYNKIKEKLIKYLKKDFFEYGDYKTFDEEKDCITFIMDHKFFYDKCVKSMENFDADFEQWIAETQEMQKEKEERENELKEIYEKCNDEKLKKILERSFIPSEYKTSLDPNIRSGFLYNGNYNETDLVMSVYKYDNSILLFNELKKDYYDFVAFYYCFLIHSWIFNLHNYCSQTDNIETLLPIYEEMVNHIKNTIERRKENGWYDDDDYEDEE